MLTSSLGRTLIVYIMTFFFGKNANNCIQHDDLFYGDTPVIGLYANQIDLI